MPLHLTLLTKVIGTTTATMLLYQQGFLQLDTRVSDSSLLGQAFATHGKAPITIKNLLLHNSGAHVLSMGSCIRFGPVKHRARHV